LKLKLTPLNIVSSAALVASVLLFAGKAQTPRPQTVDITGMLAWLSLLVAVVFFISDLIFRRFIPSLAKLWIIEGVLVIFIVILIFIIKSSLS
jgi:hypothetical protein